jgi:hypothetical protein
MQHRFKGQSLAKTFDVALNALLAELTILQVLCAVFTVWFPSSSPSFLKTLVIQQATIQSYYFRVGLGWFILNALSVLFIIIVLLGAVTLTSLIRSLRGAPQASTAPATSPAMANPATAPSAKGRPQRWATRCGYTIFYLFLSYFGAYILRDPCKPTLIGMSEVITKTDADAKMLFQYEGLLALYFAAGLFGIWIVFKLVKCVRDRFAGVKKPSVDAEAVVQGDAEEKVEEGRLLADVTKPSVEKAGLPRQPLLR